MDNDSSSTSTGLAPNVASGLAFFFTLLSGIVFIFIEKKNEQVRFWAMQGIVFGGIILVYQILMQILLRIPGLGTIFALLSLPISLAILVLWIIGLIKAFTGTMWEMPIVGALAKQYMPKA